MANAENIIHLTALTEELEAEKENLRQCEQELLQLRHRKSMLEMRKNKQARRTRTRRLIERGALLESFDEAIPTMSNEQVKHLLGTAFLALEVQAYLQQHRTTATTNKSKQEDTNDANP